MTCRGFGGDWDALKKATSAAFDDGGDKDRRIITYELKHCLCCGQITKEKIIKVTYPIREFEP